MPPAPGSSAFQFYAFFAAVILVALVNASGVVAKTIAIYTNIFAHEFISSRNALFQRLKDKVQLSAAVGVIEQTLYLYALFSGLTAVLSGVLIFKAFNGWLTIAAPAPPEAPPAPGADPPPPVAPAPAEGHAAIENLVRFYGYAIGNFVSLAFAILIYEGVRYAFAHVDWLKPYWLP